ncbi:MAG: DUF11 domain-containing protein [Acidobacteriota bacterium]
MRFPELAACARGLALGLALFYAPVPLLAQDECAAPLIAVDGSQLGMTTDNTGSTGDDTSCGTGDTVDEWYDYVATCTGEVTVSTCAAGTSFDTTLAVFDDCLGSERTCNDEGAGCSAGRSELQFSAIAGTTYRLRISGVSGATGSYALDIACDPLAPTMVGSETQVNTYTPGNQAIPSVAKNSDSFVVVWEDNSGQDGSDESIRGRRYTTDGNPVGGEFAVNSYTTGDQSQPAVAMAADGDFIVAWAGESAGDSSGINAQRFDSSGALVGSELQVNSSTSSAQTAPDISADADGDFVVVWRSQASIRGQRFDSAGTFLGGEFQVETPNLSENAPAVDMNASGAFVVAWESYVAEGVGAFAILGRRYASDGTAIDSQFQVSDGSGDLFSADVAIDSGGGFVVTWDQGYYPDVDVRAKRFDSDGNQAGAEFQVNTATANAQGFSALEMQPDGFFVVAWQSYAGDQDIHAQRYQPDGTPLAGEFIVNTYTTSQDGSPTIALDSAAEFVVAWQAGNGDYPGPDGDGGSVRTKVYGLCTGAGSLDDADGDGVFDACDVCEGDDASGDSDADGVCDDTDVCAGGDDTVDTDIDGIPDDCDATDLSITIAGATGTAGSNLTFNVTVTNNGPNDAVNVVVSDTLPSGTTFVSTSGCAEDPNGSTTCSLGTIAASSSDSYDLTVALDADLTGSIMTSVSVTSDTDEDTPGDETDTETTSIGVSADLRVSKTDSVDPVVAGENLTYTVTVNNDGPSEATNVVVTDTLPSGVTLVSTSGCLEPTAVPTCTLGTIPSGGSGQYTITVTVDADASGTLTNQASVASSTPDPDSSDDSTSEDTTVSTSADLRISKTDSVDPVVAGENLTYTVTVNNDGPSDATSVVVTDTLPAGVTLVSTSGCSEDPTAVPTCTLGTIASGGSAQYTITVSVDADASGTLTNQASVTSATSDPDSSDDATSEDTTVSASADLRISKTDSVDPVVAGENLTYTVTVNNDGPSDAQDVVVTDTLPAGVTLVSTSGCSEDPSGVPTCTLGTIASGGSAQYTITVSVDADASGTLTNQASVSASTSDPDSSDDSTSEDTTVSAEADLRISKTDSVDPVLAGENLTYTVTVNNDGPSDAQDVVVTDTLPSGVTLVSTSGCSEDPSGAPTCTLGTIASGGSAQYTITVAVDADASGTLTNQASVSASTTDPDSTDDSTSEDTTVGAEADLSISKTDSVDPVAAGENLTYTVTVNNAGPSDAANVVVTDTLPAGVTLVSTSGCAEDPNGVATCTLGTIAAAGSAQYTITVAVDADASGTLTNQASVTSDTTDPDSSDNATSEDTGVGASADLSISKTDSVDPVVAGENLTYTVTVNNAGPSDATNVVVTDTLPAGVTLVSTSGCSEDPSGVATCTLGNIAASGSAQYTITVAVDASATGTLTNQASVSSDTADSDSSDNTTSEDTTVSAEADLSISKTDSVDPVVAGENLTYTVTVANAGPSDAQNVVVTDTLPAGVTLVSTSGCAEDPSGVATCTLGTIASGDSAQYTIAVAVDADASGTLTNQANVTSSTADPDGSDNATTESTAVNSEADLAISKTDSADPVTAGASLVYTLSVTNSGPSDAAGVVITETLPAGVTLVSTSGCSEDPTGVPSCSVGTVAAGDTVQATVTVSVDANTNGVILNQASVASATPDPDGSDNTASESTTVEGTADLALTVADAPDPAAPGATVTYTFEVSNLGPAPAAGVSVATTLPAGVTLAATTGCSEDPAGVPTCSLGALASGSSTQFLVDVTVDSGTPSGDLTVSGTVASASVDPVPGNNTASATTTVDAEAPTVTLMAWQSGARSGDGAPTDESPAGSDELEECEEVRSDVVELLVTFSEDVQDPVGDSDPDDVTNPANYLLVGAGADNDFATTACGAASGDDEAIALDGVSYDAVSRVATLAIDGGLDDDLYRLLVCGSTSIRDIAGNALDGDADGSGGDDFVRSYRVERTNLFENGSFDCTVDAWELADEATYSSQDVDDSTVSGSASVTDLDPADAFAVAQCVAVTGGQSCDLTARVRLDTGGITVPTTETCTYYAQADCGGPSLGQDVNLVALTATGGAWQTLQLPVTTPAEAVSMRCAVDLQSAASFQAFIDEARLTCPDSLFADSFETGDTSAWSSTQP